MVYPLLQTAAKKRTEHVVIEAGVDTSEDAKFEMPAELLVLVQTILDSPHSGMDGTVCKIFCCAISILTMNLEYAWLSFGWMTIFDLFENAVCPAMDSGSNFLIVLSISRFG